MKFAKKFPGVEPGRLAPDERSYRASGLGRCVGCGATTDWTDVILELRVCSEECQYDVATGRQRSRAVGELLVREGLVSQADLEAALAAQRERSTYAPLGLILVERKLITRRQLDSALDRHGKWPQLGRVLVAARTITEPQLVAALSYQKKAGLRLGDALRELGYVSELALKQAICLQLNVPFVELDSWSPDPDAQLDRLIRRSYAEAHLIVPIARLGDGITLAMDDPTDRGVIETLRASTRLTVGIVISTRGAIRRALVRLYGPLPRTHVGPARRESTPLRRLATSRA